MALRSRYLGGLHHPRVVGLPVVHGRQEPPEHVPRRAKLPRHRLVDCRGGRGGGQGCRDDLPEQGVARVGRPVLHSCEHGIDVGDRLGADEPGVLAVLGMGPLEQHPALRVGVPGVRQRVRVVGHLLGEEIAAALDHERQPVGQLPPALAALVVGQAAQVEVLGRVLVVPEERLPEEVAQGGPGVGRPRAQASPLPLGRRRPGPRDPPHLGDVPDRVLVERPPAVGASPQADLQLLVVVDDDRVPLRLCGHVAEGHGRHREDGLQLDRQPGRHLLLLARLGLLPEAGHGVVDALGHLPVDVDREVQSLERGSWRTVLGGRGLLAASGALRRSLALVVRSRPGRPAEGQEK
jgi:hypothetical protein